MINKFFALLFGITISAQSIAALNNPFNKTSGVNIGADVQWVIKNGVADKTSSTSDKNGTFYQLRITQSQINLRLLSSVSGQLKSFDQLAIDDVQFDGKTSTLFQWCLSNQQSHSRFLQQGLSVKKGICQNKGKQGLFVMKLNQATYNLLKSTQNITFTIKPYRGTVSVSFDVSNMTDVFAKLSRAGKSVVSNKKPASKSTSKSLSKPMGSKKPVRSVTAPAVRPKAKINKLCSIKPPINFSSIKTNKYICNSSAAKANARKKMAASVKKARAQRAQAQKDRVLKSRQAKEKEQNSRQSSAEHQSIDIEKKRELEAISSIEQNTNKLRDEVSKKMINMCKKKWADGEHRCYCEPYLEFAPAGIKSDASCAGG